MFEIRTLEKQDQAAKQEHGWSGLPGKDWLEQMVEYRATVLGLLAEARRMAPKFEGDGADGVSDDSAQIMMAAELLTESEWELVEKRRNETAAAKAKPAKPEDGP